MHFDQPPTTSLANSSNQPWYRELNRYHWFVLAVSALGWMFDCLDQQLFTLARNPAITELRGPEDVAWYGGWVTCIFMVGWATGGIIFGLMGDRVGRARTMVITILLYSAFTGLSALSVGFWDFALYRFLTGLGVGGEFAVGVALVAEVMPDRARAHALGWLQAFSAVGNVTAALTTMGLAHLQSVQALGQLAPWRYMFLVGALPALLAVVIRRRLREPERWVAARKAHVPGQHLGSLRELFGDPRWRRGAFVGLFLAVPGVVGLWGIAFFSPDLVRSVFRQRFEKEALAKGEGDWDKKFVSAIVYQPALLTDLEKQTKNENAVMDADAKAIYAAVLALDKDQASVSRQSVLDGLDRKNQSEDDRRRRSDLLSDPSSPPKNDETKEVLDHVASRSDVMESRLTNLTGVNNLLLNIGGFLGVYSFKNMTVRFGRKPTFAIAFLFAALTTALTFNFLTRVSDLYWMVPIMGVFQFALFGGYAIYFPELFPTRLRSTGTSFCYNVGRYLASPGPVAMGTLAHMIYGHFDDVHRWRYAGITMCAFFLIGLAVLPFARETNGQPLPD